MAKKSITKELREKEAGHLDHELADKLKHLFDLRSQAVTEKLEDPSQLGKTRRDIARIKTALRQRVLEQEKSKQTQTSSKQAAAK